jgi:hypothetical protein
MRAWQEALIGSGILDLLGRFDPRIVGTLPLGGRYPAETSTALSLAKSISSRIKPALPGCTIELTRADSD